MKKKAAALKVIAFKSAFKKLKKELTHLRERVQVLERAVQSQEEDLETLMLTRDTQRERVEVLETVAKSQEEDLLILMREHVSQQRLAAMWSRITRSQDGSVVTGHANPFRPPVAWSRATHSQCEGRSQYEGQ